MIGLTKWFDHTDMPARKGVYQVKPAAGSEASWFAYWHARERLWGRIQASVDLAHQHKDEISTFQQRTWRGLMKLETA